MYFEQYKIVSGQEYFNYRKFKRAWEITYDILFSLASVSRCINTLYIIYNASSLRTIVCATIYNQFIWLFYILKPLWPSGKYLQGYYNSYYRNYCINYITNKLATNERKYLKIFNSKLFSYHTIRCLWYRPYMPYKIFIEINLTLCTV